MIYLRTSPLSSCKNLPPYFFMVHLLHRLYGVDAPGSINNNIISFKKIISPHPLGAPQKEKIRGPWARAQCAHWLTALLGDTHIHVDVDT